LSAKPSNPVNPDRAGFGIYVHWPFCASKCPYCDFNSHVRAGGIDDDAFLAAYRREILSLRDRIGPREVDTIFFGGGTPSLMAPRTVAGILDEIAKRFCITDAAEISLEANPSSVEAGRFRGYAQAGVNRVSLGVQSLIDQDLTALGRLHTAAEAIAAIDVAASHFPRYSFDLIYARPGQSESGWQRELTKALELAPSHLSLYQLTIEQGTPFAALYDKGRLKIPPAREADALFRLTQHMTAEHGLDAYEISNHARTGEQCRHNLLYWRYGEYAGIGAGAHGRLIIDGRRTATATERQPERWLAAVQTRGHGLIEEETLKPGETADEALMMGLRLTEGLDVARLQELAGLRPESAAVSELVGNGLLKDADGRLRAVGEGHFVLNELILQLSDALRPI
jgi:putative oxygen-independent coproporphyrinogen III oxidase